MPKANAEYWFNKITRNSLRDATHIEALKIQGWRIAVIWECELNKLERVRRRLAEFLN